MTSWNFRSDGQSYEFLGCSSDLVCTKYATVPALFYESISDPSSIRWKKRLSVISINGNSPTILFIFAVDSISRESYTPSDGFFSNLHLFVLQQRQMKIEIETLHITCSNQQRFSLWSLYRIKNLRAFYETTCDTTLCGLHLFVSVRQVQSLSISNCFLLECWGYNCGE